MIEKSHECDTVQDQENDKNLKFDKTNRHSVKINRDCECDKQNCIRTQMNDLVIFNQVDVMKTSMSNKQ